MKKKLLAVIIALSTILIPFQVNAKDNSTLPIDQNTYKAGYVDLDMSTQEQPFPVNAGYSEKFRIPAFTVLEDGTLFAAADARYTTTGDGGGLDTIVATSKDNGLTWEQDYAIWFPDSDGFADLISTTCIDPAIVQGSDGTIYVVADMNPTGVTTKPEYISPNRGTGYVKVNGVDRLAITDDYSIVNSNPSEIQYPYYVGDLIDGFAPVLKAEDNSATNWVLDAWWNIYELNDKGDKIELYQTQVNSSNKIQQNVFYKDSILHIYNTGYIFMATSKDNGKTWNPQIINPQIKRDSETALLVSPGKGVVTKDDRIVIPFYTFDRIDDKVIQRASFIWSNDNGNTWNRTVDAPNGNGVDWSSESEIVEVYNGVLRMFIRNGTGMITYIDAQWDNDLQDYVWSNPVVTDVKVWSGCNLTAVTYSQQIAGKMAVMVACPSGKKRTDGKIYTFLVNEDNTMIPAYAYRVNNGDYAYSCMDELNDGTIGLLYEAKPGTMKYINYDVKQLIEHNLSYESKVITISAVCGTAVGVGIIGFIVNKIVKSKKNK